MTSTIEKDFQKVNGVMVFGAKELPNWYGIENIGFIWHNSQSDPEIEYKGKRCSCCIIEDTMWERWTHDDDDNFIEEHKNDEDGFARFMLENKDEVIELVELALFGE